MLPILSLILGILPTSALVTTPIPHCTSPAHPPNLNDIKGALNIVNYLAAKFGHGRITFLRKDLPAYITPNGLFKCTQPEYHSVVRISFIGQDVAADFTHWDDVMDIVRLIVRRCLYDFLLTTAAGWIAIGDTKSLNLSLLDPHYPPGSNLSVWHPTVLKV